MCIVELLCKMGRASGFGCYDGVCVVVIGEVHLLVGVYSSMSV